MIFGQVCLSVNGVCLGLFPYTRLIFVLGFESHCCPGDGVTSVLVLYIALSSLLAFYALDEI